MLRKKETENIQNSVSTECSSFLARKKKNIAFILNSPFPSFHPTGGGGSEQVAAWYFVADWG